VEFGVLAETRAGSTPSSIRGHCQEALKGPLTCPPSLLGAIYNWCLVNSDDVGPIVNSIS